MNLEEFVLGHNQNARTRCPDCSDARKKKTIKTFSITIKPDQALYHCHHCGLSGSFRRKKFYEAHMQSEKKVVKLPTQLNYNVQAIQDFFGRRGVNLDTNLIQDFFGRRGVNLDTLDELPIMTTGTKFFGGEEKY